MALFRSFSSHLPGVFCRCFFCRFIRCLCLAWFGRWSDFIHLIIVQQVCEQHDGIHYLHAWNIVFDLSQFLKCARLAHLLPPCRTHFFYDETRFFKKPMLNQIKLSPTKIFTPIHQSNAFSLSFYLHFTLLLSRSVSFYVCLCVCLTARVSW